MFGSVEPERQVEFSTEFAVVLVSQVRFGKQELDPQRKSLAVGTIVGPSTTRSCASEIAGGTLPNY